MKQNNPLKKIGIAALFFALGAQQMSAQDNPEKLDRNFQQIYNAISSKKQAKHVDEMVQKRGMKLKESDTELYLSAIIYTKDAQALKNKGILVQTIMPNFVTALLKLSDLKVLVDMPEVTYVITPEEGQANNDIAVSETGAAVLHQGGLNNTSIKGKGVLIGIVDSGIDFTHPDFINPDGTSRIKYIWDQSLTLDPAKNEKKAGNYSYGVEYNQAEINDEIDGTPTGVVRERDTNGHGTHVAGSAGGNGRASDGRVNRTDTNGRHKGMAPEAEYVIVKTIYNETGVVDAVNYLNAKATELNKPIVINMSLNFPGMPVVFSPSPVEQAVNNVSTSSPGRFFTISAGNDGEVLTHKEDQLNINESATYTFSVPNTPATTSNTTMVSFQAHSNQEDPISGNLNFPTGVTNSGRTTSNGGRILSKKINNIDTDVAILYFSSFKSPRTNKTQLNFELIKLPAGNTEASGEYTVTLTNNSTSQAITVNGFMNAVVRKQSGATLANADNNAQITTPGNADQAITVAAYSHRGHWYGVLNNNNALSQDGIRFDGVTYDGITSFSSRGPAATSTFIKKPDISAPGDYVVSCLSSSVSQIPNYFTASVELDNITAKDIKYKADQGTSMASPLTAGAAALLFELNPQLKANEVKALLKNNTTTETGMGALPNFTWGAGKLNVFKAASSLIECTPLQHTIAKNISNVNNLLSTDVKNHNVGVKFTANYNAKLTGFNVNAGFIFKVGAFNFELRSVNNDGTPGNVLYTKTNIDVSKMRPNDVFAINLLDINAKLTAGTSYVACLKPADSANDAWSVFRKDLPQNTTGNSYTQADNVWYAQGFELMLRPVYVQDTDGAIQLVSSNSNFDKKLLNVGSTHFTTNCLLSASLLANDTASKNQTFNNKTWFNQEAGYVARSFELNPTTAVTSPQAKLTLYFTNDEFVAYNTNNPTAMALPTKDMTVAEQDANKANLIVINKSGTSSSGLVGSYTATENTITPSTIVWNAIEKRWEVSFNANSYGGFWLKTKPNTALSTNNIDALSKLTYSPNPTHNIVKISSPVVIDTYSVHNLAGQLIQEQKTNSTNLEVDLSSQPAGSYIIKITSKGKSESISVIKD